MRSANKLVMTHSLPPFFYVIVSFHVLDSDMLEALYYNFAIAADLNFMSVCTIFGHEEGIRHDIVYTLNIVNTF